MGLTQNWRCLALSYSSVTEESEVAVRAGWLQNSVRFRGKPIFLSWVPGRRQIRSSTNIRESNQSTSMPEKRKNSLWFGVHMGEFRGTR